MNLPELIKKELIKNSGKLSPTFIESIANHPDIKITHAQLTPNTRVCVVTLPSGHDLVGYAQVIDAKNDIESIGQEVAYKNAIGQLWSVCGTIAKVV